MEETLPSNENADWEESPIAAENEEDLVVESQVCIHC
jgi:hypothetical protein